MSNQAFDWWSWIARQGVFAAMLVGAAVWFGNSIVLPMRDGQTKFMEAVIKANDLNAQTNSANAAVNQQNSNLLSKVIDNQNTIISTQKVVVDAQSKITEARGEEVKYRETTTKLLEQIRDKTK